MHAAIKAVKEKVILTLGINPTRPDTGFGYIHYEGDDVVKHVHAFKEKPVPEEAQQMIAQGQHPWNGGMFILQSQTWLNAIQQSNPEISNSMNKAWNNKNTDQWFERPDSELFKQSPSDSIDYAVMEKAIELNLDVNPGKSISLQRHQRRSEHWVVIRGTASVIKDDQTFKLIKNESIFISKNQTHRLTNNTNKRLQIIEVQSGDYLGEDDIERLEDEYGR